MHLVRSYYRRKFNQSSVLLDLSTSEKDQLCDVTQTLVVYIGTLWTLLYLFILIGSLDRLWGKSLLDQDPNSLKKSKKET